MSSLIKLVSCSSLGSCSQFASAPVSCHLQTESLSVEKKTVALLKQINDLGKKDILCEDSW